MLFDADDKLIYISPDNRKFDPLAIYHRLILESKNKINEALDAWQGEDEMLAADAGESLALLSRSVFGYGSFADTGVTDSTVLKTLRHYLEWIEGKG